MKKILSMFFSVLLIGLYVSTASASHYGIPTSGQERTEIVWICNNIDDARTFVTARESYYDWIFVLQSLVGLGNCDMGSIAYVVEEVVETLSGLKVADRAFGDPILHYIIKSDDHFVVTY